MTAPPPSPLLCARDLTKVYQTGAAPEVRALGGVRLDLFPGELVVLLGGSGGG